MHICIYVSIYLDIHLSVSLALSRRPESLDLDFARKAYFTGTRECWEKTLSSMQPPPHIASRLAWFLSLVGSHWHGLRVHTRARFHADGIATTDKPKHRLLSEPTGLIRDSSKTDNDRRWCVRKGVVLRTLLSNPCPLMRVFNPRSIIEI